jgi:hypothetical protein
VALMLAAAIAVGVLVGMRLQPSPEPPREAMVKNRLHIDVNATEGATQEQELARLLRLGARHVDIGQGEQTWYVLADPEGNEFCLLRRMVD